MNSKNGGGKGPYAAAGSSSTEGKSVGSQHANSSGGFNSANNSIRVDQANRDVADVGADFAKDGEWEVCGKKSRNLGGAGRGRGASTASPKTWGHQEMLQKPGMAANGWTAWQAQTVDSKQAGRGNMKPQPSNRGLEAAYMAPAIAPPLQHGWQWNARAGSSNPSQPQASKDSISKNVIILEPLHQGTPASEDYESETSQKQEDDASDDEELEVDSDDDLLCDDYDSDVSQKSYETRKKNKWFNTFFEALDSLNVDEISEPSRQWHCPACHGGPGAIDWYRGLQPLITHAKTRGSRRAKLHRELAELLEEELRRKGTKMIPSGETFGKWKGLHETIADHAIVWPPMVIIRNTFLELDENDKWIGMGNQELLDYFRSYDAVKARHSYGPQGHRGISVLIFDSSPIGYFEAERLSKHFEDEGTDRDAWDSRRVLFYPGGKRQLYGYLACKEDVDDFNKHCPGKSKLKFEMGSYHEKVVSRMKQMSEDNELLTWYKNKVSRQQQNEKVLKETMGVMSKKLRIASEENEMVRLRTTVQHEENKEQMDYLEHHYKEEIEAIRETMEAKERAFEKLLQEEREKVKLSNSDSGSKEDRKLRREVIDRFIDSQTKGIEEFEAEREKMVQAHEDKKTEMKQRHFQEEVNLEKEFDVALTQLMEKYAPQQSSEPSAS